MIFPSFSVFCIFFVLVSIIQGETKINEKADISVLESSTNTITYSSSSSGYGKHSSTGYYSSSSSSRGYKGSSSSSEDFSTSYHLQRHSSTVGGSSDASSIGRYPGATIIAGPNKPEKIGNTKDITIISTGEAAAYSSTSANSKNKSRK